MRPLIAVMCLLASVALAADGNLLGERQQSLTKAAQATAAKMKGFDGYVRYLKPFPNHVLIGDEVTGYILFDDGWKKKESEGRWSEGHSSKIYLRIPPGKRPFRLYLHGRYFGGEEATRVIVNGRLLSSVALTHHNIEIPAGITKNGTLEIEFQHLNPLRSSGHAEKEGKLPGIKFFLVRIQVRYLTDTMPVLHKDSDSAYAQ